MDMYRSHFAEEGIRFDYANENPEVGKTSFQNFEVKLYFNVGIDDKFGFEANEVLKKIYREGYQYKKAGVIVMGIGADSPIQQDLFDINAEQFQKMKRLDEVIDRINRMHGSETIVLGSQQYTRKDGKGKADVFANAIKHDFRSPSPTTRWSEVIRLNSNAKKKDNKNDSGDK
jgi:hypothetical protein